MTEVFRPGKKCDYAGQCIRECLAKTVISGELRAARSGDHHALSSVIANHNCDKPEAVEARRKGRAFLDNQRS